MSHHKHKHEDTEHKPAPQGEAEPGAAASTGAPAGATPAADAVPPADQAKPQDPVAVLKAERDDLLARLQRVSADYMNYQKRVQRDVEQAREYGNESLLKALLPILDDMERALQAAKDHPDDMASLVKGMGLVRDKALSVVGAFGLTAMETTGKPFDPAHHSALMQQPSKDVPPQTVLNEVQKGYLLKGRTLRPAQVIVSKAPDEA